MVVEWGTAQDDDSAQRTPAHARTCTHEFDVYTILETLSESWYRSEISYNPPNLFLCCAPINST